MKLFFLSLILVSASAVADLPEIGLRAQYESPSEPLTTEKAWLLDPAELNPHRRRWLLHRQVALVAVEPVELGPERFGARVGGIEASTRSFIRGPGPWYREFEDFRCQQEPVTGFATATGSRKAADEAAKLWEETLREERLKLSLLLQRITATSGDLAVSRAKIAFDVWLQNVESIWRVRAEQKARMAEWRYYLQHASESKICPAARKKPPVRETSWQEMMEEVPAFAPTDLKLLARAPARRWEGLYTIRVSVDVAGRRLNGRFLVDSGAGASIINPIWLESQGILSAWVELPGSVPQRVIWSGGEGLARRMRVEKIEIGNYPVQLTEFLLLETELFGPPNEVAVCCDGILGADFLKQFAVEFALNPPALNLWKRDRFNLGAETPWVEIALSPRGDMVSDCVMSGGTRLEGLRWDTGNVSSLDIHRPWWSKVGRPGEWDVRCGDVKVGGKIPGEFPKRGRGPLTDAHPAASAGIALLARGGFTLDVPHGRLWFARDALAAPVLENRSGLRVKYVMNDGNRRLLVESLKPGSPASKLGLSVGTEIVQLDGKSADEIDLWEVDQRLAGAFGDTVVLQWHYKKRARIAPLKVGRELK